MMGTKEWAFAHLVAVSLDAFARSWEYLIG
jgi:hypothetical protein